MREFRDWDRAEEALRDAGEGWVLESCRWLLREKTIEEYAQDWEFENDSVPVHIEIPTSADLHSEEMADEDWIELGKMVADVARHERKWRSR